MIREVSRRFIFLSLSRNQGFDMQPKGGGGIIRWEKALEILETKNDCLGVFADSSFGPQNDTPLGQSSARL